MNTNYSGKSLLENQRNKKFANERERLKKFENKL